jgi:hypothetical protein
VRKLELGVAASIGVKQISGEFVDDEINRWLKDNSDIGIIEIKFSASAQGDEWGVDALIIFRKE